LKTTFFEEDEEKDIVVARGGREKTWRCAIIDREREKESGVILRENSERKRERKTQRRT